MLKVNIMDSVNPDGSVEETVVSELDGVDVSDYLTSGYADHLDVDTLDVSDVRVTDEGGRYSVCLDATNVTVGTQKGNGGTVDLDGYTVDIFIKPA